VVVVVVVVVVLVIDEEGTILIKYSQFLVTESQ